MPSIDERILVVFQLVGEDGSNGGSLKFNTNFQSTTGSYGVMYDFMDKLPEISDSTAVSAKSLAEWAAATWSMLDLLGESDYYGL